MQLKIKKPFDEVRLSAYLRDNQIEEKFLKNRNDYWEETKKLLFELVKKSDWRKEFKDRCDIFRSSMLSEISFQCDKFIVDVDLNQNLWHGININISAHDIEVEAENEVINWDLSGHNAYEIFSESEPHISFFKNGLRGFDGEDGGNLKIEVSGNIFSQQPNRSWFIKSNGGNGGQGENGKLNESSKNGKATNVLLHEWTKGDIPKLFEEERIRQHAEIEEIESSSCKQFYQKQFTDFEGRQYILFQGKNSRKNFVKTSYAVLFRGSLGTSGTPGGLGGKGGDAGQPGNISIPDTTILCSNYLLDNQHTVSVTVSENKEGCKGQTGKRFNYVMPPKPGSDLFIIDGKGSGAKEAKFTIIKCDDETKSISQRFIYYKTANNKKVRLYFDVDKTWERYFKIDISAFDALQMMSESQAVTAQAEEVLMGQRFERTREQESQVVTSVIVSGPQQNSVETFVLPSNYDRKHIDTRNFIESPDFENLRTVRCDHRFIVDFVDTILLLEEGEEIDRAHVIRILTVINLRGVLRIISLWKGLKLSLAMLELISLSEIVTDKIFKQEPNTWIEGVCDLLYENTVPGEIEKSLLRDVVKQIKTEVSQDYIDNFLLYFFLKYQSEKPLPFIIKIIPNILRLLPNIISKKPDKIWKFYFTRHITEWETFLELDNFCISNLREFYNLGLDDEKLELLGFYMLKLEKSIPLSKYSKLLAQVLEEIKTDDFNFNQLLLDAENMINNYDYIETYLNRGSTHTENSTDDISSEELIEKLLEDETKPIAKMISYNKTFFIRAIDEIFNNITDKTLLDDIKKQEYVLLDNLVDKIMNDFKVPESFHESKHDSVTEQMTVILKLIQEVACVINNLKKIVLRKVQIMAILLYFTLGLRELSEEENSRNIQRAVFEINTGEGKTVILVAVAIVSVLLGDKYVEIITSTSSLAKRDHNNYKEVYDYFEISTDYIKEEEQWNSGQFENLKVIYGNLTSFLKILLYDLMVIREGTKLMGSRKTNTILVDEVDNLILDKSTNVLYLAQSIPFLDKLDTVFIEIFKLIQDESLNDSDIKRQILEKRLNRISIPRLMSLHPRVTEPIALKLFHDLMQKNAIDDYGFFQFDPDNNGYPGILIDKEYFYSSSDPDPDLGEIKRQIENALHFLQRDGQRLIPHYLCKFVKLHVEKWIQNARLALKLQHKVHYEIDMDDGDKFSKIILIDKDTGSDMVNAEWEEGLSQFLQIKHNLRITQYTLKSVFWSTVAYFKGMPGYEFQTNLLGVTGTLGSFFDQEVLKTTHKAESIRIPPAKETKMRLELPTIRNSFEDWLKAIENRVRTVALLSRPVLVVAETIHDAENIHNHLTDLKELKDHGILIKLYARSKQINDINDIIKNMNPNTVIVATNLAGRALDIILSIENDLNKPDGGLHLILTYLPPNERIERQAFGRVARNGQPGSVEMILLDYGYHEDKPPLMHIVRNKIDRLAAEKLKLILADYEYYNKIDTQEKYFNLINNTNPSESLFNFDNLDCCIYEDSRCFVRSVSLDERSFVRNVSLEMWAFYLDEMFSDLGRRQELLHEFEQRIPSLEPDFSNWIEWRGTDIASTIDAAGILSYESLLNYVAFCEPFFSEAAIYYKAKICLTSPPVTEEDVNTAKKYLLSVKKKLDLRIEAALLNIFSLLSIMNQDIDEKLHLQILVKFMTQIIMSSDIAALITMITGQPIQEDDLRNITSNSGDLIQKLQERNPPLLTKWEMFTADNETEIKYIAKYFGIKFEHFKAIFIGDDAFSTGKTCSYQHKELGDFHGRFISFVKNRGRQSLFLPIDENILISEYLNEDDAENVLSTLSQAQVLRRNENRTYTKGSNFKADIKLLELSFWHEKSVKHMLWLIDFWEENADKTKEEENIKNNVALIIQMLVDKGILIPPKPTNKIKIKKPKSEGFFSEINALLKNLTDLKDVKEEIVNEKAEMLSGILYHFKGTTKLPNLSDVELDPLTYLDPHELSILKLNGFNHFYSADRYKAFDNFKTFIRNSYQLIVFGIKKKTNETVFDIYEKVEASIPEKKRPTYQFEKFLSSHIFKKYRSNKSKQREVLEFCNQSIELMNLLVNETGHEYFKPEDIGTLKDQLKETSDQTDEELSNNIESRIKTYNKVGAGQLFQRSKNVQADLKVDVCKFILKENNMQIDEINENNLQFINRSVFDYFMKAILNSRLGPQIVFEPSGLSNEVIYMEKYDENETAHNKNLDLLKVRIKSLLIEEFLRDDVEVSEDDDIFNLLNYEFDDTTLENILARIFRKILKEKAVRSFVHLYDDF